MDWQTHIVASWVSQSYWLQDWVINYFNDFHLWIHLNSFNCTYNSNSQIPRQFDDLPPFGRDIRNPNWLPLHRGEVSNQEDHGAHSHECWNACVEHRNTFGYTNNAVQGTEWKMLTEIPVSSHIGSREWITFVFTNRGKVACDV